MCTEFEVTAVLRDEVYAETELVSIFCGEIVNKQSTSQLIRELSMRHPLPNLSHLKRVKRTEAQLFVILKECSGDLCVQEDQLHKLEQEVQRDPNLSLGLGRLSVARVPKTKPITRKQYEECLKYWPTHYHEDKRLERALKGSLFSGEELKCIQHHMTDVMDMLKANLHREGKASTVIVSSLMVDPLTDQVLARVCVEHERRNVLKHAVMMCIDKVAQCQRGGQQGMEHKQQQQLQPLQQSRDNTGLIKEGTVTPSSTPDHRDSSLDIGASLPKRPKRDHQYLCMGYDLYTSKEPCVMCAMALLHSRIGRVFYSSCDAFAGGISSNYKIHTHQSLNHHFEAYIVC